MSRDAAKTVCGKDEYSEDKNLASVVIAIAGLVDKTRVSAVAIVAAVVGRMPSVVVLSWISWEDDLETVLLLVLLLAAVVAVTDLCCGSTDVSKEKALELSITNVLEMRASIVFW